MATKIIQLLGGQIGANGKSAYAYAKDNGYTGTEQEFAEALARIVAVLIYGGETEGGVSADGKSAYEYAQEGGYTGTEQEFAKKLATDYIPAAGGTMTGILYTSGYPLFIGKNGKVGMRAATDEVEGVNHVGQMNISNSWWNTGNQWGAQMSGYNGETGKYNEFRISHEGLQYFAESDTPYQVLHEGNCDDYISNIENIEKTSTEGRVDTYTISTTNGKTFTFSVTNGEKGDDGAVYTLTEADKATIVDAVLAKIESGDEVEY